jgi:hypothetical protein
MQYYILFYIHNQAVYFKGLSCDNIVLNTVKKDNDFPVPSRDLTYQTLVSDIPAGDDKNAHLFFSVERTVVYIKSGINVQHRSFNLKF